MKIVKLILEGFDGFILILELSFNGVDKFVKGVCVLRNDGVKKLILFAVDGRVGRNVGVIFGRSLDFDGMTGSIF